MGHTCNSIVINAPYDLIFDISNDIPRWTKLFGSEYKKAEIVKKDRHGRIIRSAATKVDSHCWYHPKRSMTAPVARRFSLRQGFGGPP